jgi:hypothetical protein
MFHEECLKRWFVQAQICPMCRGNIIRMPRVENGGDQPENGEAGREEGDI